jgi:hypothetical protein
MKKPAEMSAAVYTTNRPARTVMAVTLLALVGALTACSGNEPTGPNGQRVPKTFVGSYDVTTVNDKALPVAIFADTEYTYERISGTLTLTLDGRYSAKMTSRQTIAGRVDLFVDSTGGKWTYTDSLVTFADDDHVTIEYAKWVDPGKFTFTQPDGKDTNTYVYVKKG